MEIELQSIDLDVQLAGEDAATVRFRLIPADAKAAIEPFSMEITVPRRGSLDDARDAAFRAMHRTAQALEEKLRPPA